MASIEQIGTMAMTLLKRKPIVSITENTEQAQLVSAVYPVLRDALLEEYAWSFANKRVHLQPVPVRPAFEWLYAHQIPSDLIMPLDLKMSMGHPSSTEPSRGYNEGGYNEGGYGGGESTLMDHGVWGGIDSSPWVIEGQTILSNAKHLCLKYTYRVTETGLFGSMFTLALAHNIAATLAYPITGNEKLSEELMKISAGLIAKAQARDAQKGTWQPSVQRDSWLRGRQTFRNRGWMQGRTE